MKHKTLEELVAHCGFEKLSDDLWSASGDHIEELIDSVQRLTILNIISSLAVVHDAIAGDGQKVVIKEDDLLSRYKIKTGMQ
jgi:hypothetical protein